MDLSLEIYRLWPVFASALGFVAWLIRLESKVMVLEKDITEKNQQIDRLDIKIGAIEGKIIEKLSMIEKSLAKIEGRLSVENDLRKL